MTTKRINITELKALARGRWLEIFSTIAGVQLDPGCQKRHGPCPRCGGLDRFRAVDLDSGALLCNQCFSSRNGDGLAALGWLTGKPFKEVVATLCEYLGAKPTHKSNGKAERQKVFATPRGAVCYYTDALAKQHGQGVRFAKSWAYDTFHVLRFDLPTPAGEKQQKEFRPVHQVPLGLDGGIGWQAGYPAGPRPLYRLAELQAASDTSLIVVGAGEKVVDAAAELGLIATTCAGGELAVDRTDWAPLARFAQAVVTIDNDKTGEQFGADITIKLRNIRPDMAVKILRLPGLPVKGDLIEWLAAGGTRDVFLHLVEATAPLNAEQVQEFRAGAGNRSRGKGDQRVIELGFDESRVVDEAIEILAATGNVYQRASMLVHVVRGGQPPRGIARPADAPHIANIKPARLRELLAAGATWQRLAGDDVEQCHPPDWVIKAVDARGEWMGVAPLVGVVEVPVLRADGTIVQQPGYDEPTGLIYRPQIAFPVVAEKPTRANAQHAVDTLLDVIAEFPYPSDHHRAGWLSAVITPLVRYAIPGPAPLHLFDANVAGCGKTLQADTASMIATGRAASKMAMPRDDDETRKRITAIALSAEQIILIDNIPSMLGGASLDAALTATSWSDRILGESRMAIAIPLYCTWMATGNNVILLGDTGRRTLPIRLESPDEHPEERSGFRHPDLLGWVRENRAELAAAAITIPAAYCAAGRPDMRLKPWGSYQDWSDLIRSALVWAGMPDPAQGRVNIVSQSDREAAALRALVAGWEEADPDSTGMTCADAVQLLDKHPGQYQTLRSAVAELATAKGTDKPNARSLAMKLYHVRQRVVGGRYFDKREQHHTAVWFVVPAAVGKKGELQEVGEVALPDAPTHTHAHAHTPAHTLGGITSPTSSTSPDAEEPMEATQWTG